MSILMTYHVQPLIYRLQFATSNVRSSSTMRNYRKILGNSSRSITRLKTCIFFPERRLLIREIVYSCKLLTIQHHFAGHASSKGLSLTIPILLILKRRFS